VCENNNIEEEEEQKLKDNNEKININLSDITFK